MPSHISRIHLLKSFKTFNSWDFLELTELFAHGCPFYAKEGEMSIERPQKKIFSWHIVPFGMPWDGEPGLFLLF